MNINEALITLNKNNKKKNYIINESKNVSEGKGRRVNPKIMTVYHVDGYWDNHSYYPKTGAKYIYIEDGVTELDNDCCKNCTAVTAEIPDSVIRIGDNAFYECNELDDVDMPKNLKYLGRHAFYRTGLQEIELPKGITKIQEGTFENCYDLKEVHLPPTLTEIGAFAFAGCENLETINLPKTITSIQSYAFSHSGTAEKTLIVPPNIKIIEEGTFQNNYWGKVILPDGLQTIEAIAFEGSNPAVLIIPETVVSIGDDALKFSEHAHPSIVLPDKFKDDLSRIGINASAVEVKFWSDEYEFPEDDIEDDSKEYDFSEDDIET